MLSPEDIERFHRDGFCLVEDFASASACRALRQRALEIVHAFRPSAERTVFTTDDQERTSNREFLDSGSSIWCFFEAEAFGPTGELVQPKELSINKVGHAMHDLDDVFSEFSYTPELAAVAADVGMVEPLAVQSMYIFKQPYIGGEVGCHQDATFLWTDPLSVVGFWFAVEDATVDNGCLWVHPGGHRGPLRTRFERAAADAGSGARFTVLDATPLPQPPGGPAERTKLVPLEASAGTLVVLHGLLPHWSGVNRSPASRHAYSLHCVEASAAWPATNWLQRTPDLPFRRLDATATERVG